MHSKDISVFFDEGLSENKYITAMRFSGNNKFVACMIEPLNRIAIIDWKMGGRPYAILEAGNNHYDSFSFHPKNHQQLITCGT